MKIISENQTEIDLLSRATGSVQSYGIREDDRREICLVLNLEQTRRLLAMLSGAGGGGYLIR